MNVYNVLQQAGVIPKEFEASRNDALIMGRIPQDVLNILGIGQKTVLVRDRLLLCRTFQKQLEDFWKLHYNAKPGKRRLAQAVNAIEPGLRVEEIALSTIDDVYQTLNQANFDVIYDGNRDIHILAKFLAKVERGELQPDDYVKWAMTTASALPDTFGAVFDLYTGRTKIDIRPFFPRLKFTD